MTPTPPPPNVGNAGSHSPVLFAWRVSQHQVPLTGAYLGVLATTRTRPRTLLQLTFTRCPFPLVTRYDATCVSHGQSHHTLVSSMFLASAQPFLRFLEEWVWDGTLSDPQFEFGVVLDIEALRNKKGTYWGCANALEDGCTWQVFTPCPTSTPHPPPPALRLLFGHIGWRCLLAGTVVLSWP